MSKVLVWLFFSIFVGFFLTNAEESDGPDNTEKPISNDRLIRCRLYQDQRVKRALHVCDYLGYQRPGSCFKHGCPIDQICCYDGCHFVCQVS
ncbi:UNVERIFIED_CONTAM: hypothetical protein RMT77_008267 [Armadillidium vulgare]